MSDQPLYPTPVVLASAKKNSIVQKSQFQKQITSLAATYAGETGADALTSFIDAAIREARAFYKTNKDQGREVIITSGSTLCSKFLSLSPAVSKQLVESIYDCLLTKPDYHRNAYTGLGKIFMFLSSCFTK